MKRLGTCLGYFLISRLVRDRVDPGSCLACVRFVSGSYSKVVGSYFGSYLILG